MKKNAAIILLLLLVAGGATTFIYMRQEPPVNDINVANKQEAKKQELQMRDVIDGSLYRSDTARLAMANRALRRDSAELARKVKAATTKAALSALNYNKTPTLANCNQALSDCQEENESKAGVIDLQYLMLAGKDVEQQRDRQEIGRLNEVRDSAFAGWGAANEALKKAGKPKPWGLGIQAGYGAGKQGLTPFVGIGVSYTPIRF